MNDREKIWDRPWSTEEIIQHAENWSLAADVALLNTIKAFANKLITKTDVLNDNINGLLHNLDEVDLKLDISQYEFQNLKNTQFVESRVYDDDETLDSKENEKVPIDELQHTSEENDFSGSSEFKLLDKYYEVVEISISDSEDESEKSFVLKSKDVYEDRQLPPLIGSNEWYKNWFIEDQNSDVDSQKSLEMYSESDSDDNLPKDLFNGSESSSELEFSQPPSETRPAAHSTFHDNIIKPESVTSSDDSEDLNTLSANAISNKIFAKQLAARLDTVISTEEKLSQEINTQPIQAPKTDPFSVGLFSDEPPPLSDYEDKIMKGIFSGGKNLFDDGDEEDPMFWNKDMVPEKRVEDDEIKKDIFPKSSQTVKGIFDSDNSEDDLFVPQTQSTKKPIFLQSDKPVIPLFDNEPPGLDIEKTDQIKKKPTGGISIFGTEDIWKSLGNQQKNNKSVFEKDSPSVVQSKIEENEDHEVNKTVILPKISKGLKGIFDSDNSDDDLFAPQAEHIRKPKRLQLEEHTVPLFDEGPQSLENTNNRKEQIKKKPTGEESAVGTRDILGNGQHDKKGSLDQITAEESKVTNLLKSDIKREQETKSSNVLKAIFDSDESDDDLFAPKIGNSRKSMFLQSDKPLFDDEQPGLDKKKIPKSNKKKPAGGVSIFGTEDIWNVLGNRQQNNNEDVMVKKDTIKTSKGIFDSDDSDEDLFIPKTEDLQRQVDIFDDDIPITNKLNITETSKNISTHAISINENESYSVSQTRSKEKLLSPNNEVQIKSSKFSKGIFDSDDSNDDLFTPYDKKPKQLQPDKPVVPLIDDQPPSLDFEKDGERPMKKKPIRGTPIFGTEDIWNPLETKQKSNNGENGGKDDGQMKNKDPKESPVLLKINTNKKDEVQGKPLQISKGVFDSEPFVPKTRQLLQDKPVIPLFDDQPPSLDFEKDTEEPLKRKPIGGVSIFENENIWNLGIGQQKNKKTESKDDSQIKNEENQNNLNLLKSNINKIDDCQEKPLFSTDIFDSDESTDEPFIPKIRQLQPDEPVIPLFDDQPVSLDFGKDTEELMKKKPIGGVPIFETENICDPLGTIQQQKKETEVEDGFQIKNEENLENPNSLKSNINKIDPGQETPLQISKDIFVSDESTDKSFIPKTRQVQPDKPVVPLFDDQPPSLDFVEDNEEYMKQKTIRGVPVIPLSDDLPPSLDFVKDNEESMKQKTISRVPIFGTEDMWNPLGTRHQNDNGEHGSKDGFQIKNNAKTDIQGTPSQISKSILDSDESIDEPFIPKSRQVQQNKPVVPLFDDQLLSLDLVKDTEEPVKKKLIGAVSIFGTGDIWKSIETRDNKDKFQIRKDGIKQNSDFLKSTQAKPSDNSRSIFDDRFIAKSSKPIIPLLDNEPLEDEKEKGLPTKSNENFASTNSINQQLTSETEKVKPILSDKPKVPFFSEETSSSDHKNDLQDSVKHKPIGGVSIFGAADIWNTKGNRSFYNKNEKNDKQNKSIAADVNLDKFDDNHNKKLEIEESDTIKKDDLNIPVPVPARRTKVKTNDNSNITVIEKSSDLNTEKILEMPIPVKRTKVKKSNGNNNNGESSKQEVEKNDDLNAEKLSTIPIVQKRTKPTKLFNDDDLNDDDLFASPKKPVVSNMNTGTNNVSLFGEDDRDKNEKRVTKERKGKGASNKSSIVVKSVAGNKNLVSFEDYIDALNNEKETKDNLDE